MANEVIWKSSTMYVDKDTGEIISKRLVERDYIKIRTIKTTIVKDGKGIIKYTTECEKDRQARIW